ncbi:hypothetical protein L1049_017743 [Liquidambar formosana]|uniref:SKP1 component POZ domain-containing protein n=1 Tax=Liquidambar formosana TaxID=63359 RepID=A0AAP0X4K5_LIQFO
MIEENPGCAQSVIRLPTVTGNILSKVIDYCKAHVKASKSDKCGRVKLDPNTWDADFVKVDHATLYDLIQAAEYLNIKSLLDLTSCAMLEKISPLNWGNDEEPDWDWILEEEESDQLEKQ